MASDFATRVMSSFISREALDTNMFTTPRTENEIDLVAACRDMLISAGLMNNVVTAFDSNQYIIDATLLGEKAQRFLLNKFWHIQLCNLDCDTQRERFCLVDQGTAQDWIKCFKDGVMPKILERQLPVCL